MYPDVLFSIGGFEIDLYMLMYLVGIAGMFVICILTRKKYDLSKLKAGVYTLITFVFGVLGAKLMGKIYAASLDAVTNGEYIPNSGVCIFGAIMFLPFFMLLLSLFVKETFRHLSDYMTPGIFFILACAKFGCFMEGCCYGVPSENGVYNHIIQCNVFPVQLYESICTFAVTAVLIVLALKSKKIRAGALYPAGVIIYCSARLFWENFRYYGVEAEKDFFAGLTYWQCWSVAAVVFSAVWLVILYDSEKFRSCPLKKEAIGLFIIADNITKKKDEKNKIKYRQNEKKYQEKAREIKKKAHKK